MRNISQDMLRHLREKYKPGTRVKLIHMDDPYTRLSPGELGIVTGVDDIGTIHVNWDCGSSLGVAYGEDSCQAVNGEVQK